MAKKLSIIISSTRPGRVGPVFAKWFHDYAKAHGAFDVEILDLADFNLPLLDEPKHPIMQDYQHAYTKRWAAAVAGSDAFAFVIPEYDAFPPATLVNAVQYLVKEWQYKPATFVSYGGVSAGLRSVQAVKSLLSSLKIVPLPEQVSIPAFFEHIKDGTFAANALHEKGALDALNELARWADALAVLRAK